MVYNGNYLAFFETGRVEALRQVGEDYRVLVASGVQLPVVEATVRYLIPARFDDVLLIYARVTEVRKVRFKFEYEIRREDDGALLTTGHTIHTCVDSEKLRPIRTPPGVIEVLGRLA